MISEKEILEMAKQANLSFDDYPGWVDRDEVISFANLISIKAAEIEREECAKVCQELLSFNMDDPGQSCADAIRTRGNQRMKNV